MLEILISLGFLFSSAVLVTYLGARRLLERTLNVKRDHDDMNEVMNTSDALAVPFVGSMALFSIYVLLRFVPLEYFNILICFYLSIVGIYCLGSFIKAYVRPNFLTGTMCFVVGGFYFWTNNWMLNNILAIGIAVTALEAVHLKSFASSCVLLLGLFFYDIFWVFGSDVMLTVASGVNGPIKLVFPRTIFGDHQAKSLLGLGDLIVPGFFISQTLVFSSEYVKRGSLYFYVALVAYALSLINTMAVMIIFEHGQPALLFIVPWLLITFFLTALVKGDVKAVFAYSSDAVTEQDVTEESGSATNDNDKKKEDEKDEEEDVSVLCELWKATCEMFGIVTEKNSPTGVDEKKKKE